jgi:hypothetical protein
MNKSSKRIFLVMVLFTLLVSVVYAGYCEYKCVFCSMVVVTGCGSPPSSWGYCSRAPDKMHAYVLTRQTR